MLPYPENRKNGYPIDDDQWIHHARLARDLRALAAPQPSKTRGYDGNVTDEDWIQLGGHIQYFRDGTRYDYRLGAVLEKHGFSRDFARGAAYVQTQIDRYQAAIPKWCEMLETQLPVFIENEQAFREEAEHWVLLLQIPTLPRLGANWGNQGYVSFMIDHRELRNKRFDQSWVLFHP